MFRLLLGVCASFAGVHVDVCNHFGIKTAAGYITIFALKAADRNKSVFALGPAVVYTAIMVLQWLSSM